MTTVFCGKVQDKFSFGRFKSVDSIACLSILKSEFPAPVWRPKCTCCSKFNNKAYLKFVVNYFLGNY